jgi:hypothetical protein
MVRADMDDEDDVTDEVEDWEEAETETEGAEPRDTPLFEVARAEDRDDADFEE